MDNLNITTPDNYFDIAVGRWPVLRAGGKRACRYRDRAAAHGETGCAHRGGILCQRPERGGGAGAVRPDRQHGPRERPEKGTGEKRRFHPDAAP